MSVSDDDSTPVGIPAEVRAEIYRWRRSSQHAIDRASILVVASEELSPEEFEIELRAALQAHARSYARILQEQLDFLSTQLGKERLKVEALRRAILVDFLSDGSVEDLVQAAIREDTE